MTCVCRSELFSISEILWDKDTKLLDRNRRVVDQNGEKPQTKDKEE